MYVLGDQSKPRSWSKYASDSSHNKAKSSNVESKEKLNPAGKDDIKSKSDKKKEKKADHKKNNEIKEALEKVFLLQYFHLIIAVFLIKDKLLSFYMILNCYVILNLAQR